jgi:hypothetical protein
MKRWAIPVFSVVLAVAVTEEVLRTPAAAVDPGAGVALTSYGRNVWNLEALLRSTFGRRNLFIDYGVSRRRANFTTRRRASYRSGYYRYTFTDPADSTFRVLRPARPPQPEIGASGGEVPITIRGAYVACPGGLWLFMHFGNGPANWQIGCRPE